MDGVGGVLVTISAKAREFFDRINGIYGIGDSDAECGI
jgi:hypothetical protein